MWLLASRNMHVDSFSVQVNDQTIENEFKLWLERLPPGDVALVYFSGHGEEHDGCTHLIPSHGAPDVNTDADYAHALKKKAVDAEWILQGHWQRIKPPTLT